jgi:mRNA-degrading endonuclease RelE of RelBE toxin-antitoxin system
MGTSRRRRPTESRDLPPASQRAGQGTKPGHPSWRLRFASRILEEDIQRLGSDAYERAKKAIQKKLSVDPEHYGERLHSPLHGLFKLKSSHVRVTYHIEAKSHEVWILLIGDRRTIWESKQGEILQRLTKEHKRAAAQQSEAEASRTLGSQSVTRKRRG